MLNAKSSAYVSIILCIFHYIHVLKPIQLIIIFCWKAFGPIGLFLRGARSHAHLPVRSWSATIILEGKTVLGPLRSPSISLTDLSLSVGVSDRIGPQWASLSLSEVNTRSFHRPMHASTCDQERNSTSNHPGDVTHMS